MANYKNDGKPSFHILICLIEIWKPNDVAAPMEKPDRSKITLITECEQIEIVESYKQLIGTANIKFPRGTVIRKTITEANYKYNPTISATINDNGVLLTERADSELAQVTDFHVGDRITIRLGYTDDPKVADMARVNRDANKTIFNNSDILSTYRGYLTTMFEGYIAKVSLDSPIELQCENLAGGLKRFTCPKKTYKKATVNQLFGSGDGSDNLLAGTGLILDPKTSECNISIGQLEMTTDLTPADILLKLNERGLYGFVQFKYDEASKVTKPMLTIGRSYFSNPKDNTLGEDSILKIAQRFGDSTPIDIDFAYNVADNGLSLMDTEKEFMVVEATGTDKDGKTLHVTVRLNPEWTDDMPESEKWQFLNETTETKKQKKKKAKGKGKSQTTRKKRWKMSEYTTIKFISKEVTTTMKDLKAEACKYFQNYNMNGIDGSLTLFGDHRDRLRTARIVTLNDPRQPNKNGQYLVEEVVTKFGVNGFRQQIKLPYCLQRNSQSDNNTQQTGGSSRAQSIYEEQ